MKWVFLPILWDFNVLKKIRVFFYTWGFITLFKKIHFLLKNQFFFLLKTNIIKTVRIEKNIWNKSWKKIVSRVFNNNNFKKFV